MLNNTLSSSEKTNKACCYAFFILFFLSIALPGNIFQKIALIGIPAFILGINNLTFIFNEFASLKNTKKLNANFIYILPIIFGLIFFALSGFKELYLASFLGIFSSTLLIVSLPHKNHLNDIANVWLIIGIINTVGILFGLVEKHFLASSYFIEVLLNSPYSGETKTSISGFLYNYNQAAYFQVCSIALIKFQNIFSEKKASIILIALLISLMLTTSKFALLFICSLVIITLFRKNNKIILPVLLVGLFSSYIFLTNIIVALPGSYSIPSHHFRQLLFSLFGYDFVLGTYGHFKVTTFNFIFWNKFYPFGMGEFVNQTGFVPHNMIGGNMLAGGYFLTISLGLIILKTLKSVLIAPCQFLNHYYLTALLVFIVETVNWDFSHALYFWILVLLIPSIKKPLKQANYFKE